MQVQRLMAGMADRGATACVMECSSIGLHQGRVENVDFDVAIFTNLGSDHLDYHEGDSAPLSPLLAVQIFTLAHLRACVAAFAETFLCAARHI